MTMMASNTGLSALPRVSLPKLTSEAGSKLMINSPTAGTGEPAGATSHAASTAIPRPARPATAPASLAHHRVARATWRSSRLCTSPSCARTGRWTTSWSLRISHGRLLIMVVAPDCVDYYLPGQPLSGRHRLNALRAGNFTLDARFRRKSGPEHHLE